MTRRKICSLRLVEGTSQSPGFTLTSALRRAVLRVGSARECNWRVHGEGVQKHHFMFMWNGAALTVIDVGVDDLFVNGEAISLTKDLRSGRVDFGSAAIVVDHCVLEDPVGKLRPPGEVIAHQRAQDGATEPGQVLSLIAKSKIEENT